MRSGRVHWVFDDPLRDLTMTSCPDTVLGDDLHLVSGRFPMANMFHYWKHNWWNRSDLVWESSGLDQRPNRYAYNIGTWMSAGYWTGWSGNDFGFDNFLNHVPKVVMDDARIGRAKLVIDNLNEGFYEPQFYEFMHESLGLFALPPQSIIWLTGNELDPQGYHEWCDRHGIMARMSMIGFCHLMYMQQLNLRNSALPQWDQHAAAKQQQRRIRNFNCLNRVSREHREFFMMMLVDRDLHRQGMVSHNRLTYGKWAEHGVPQALIDKTIALLPLVIDDNDFGNNKAMHINMDIYLRSWISVITETHAFDSPHHLFISEKLWKPIFALQPFMVLGHRNSLALLRKWGYETYGMLWDESYDDRDFGARVSCILNNLQQMQVIVDKRGWLDQAREICEYNQKWFMGRDWFESQSHADFMLAYEWSP